MNRMKLGEILSVKHGWAFKGEYFAEDGEQSILTPGNFFEKGLAIRKSFCYNNMRRQEAAQ